VRNDLACVHIPFIKTVPALESLTVTMLDTAQSIVITSRKAVESLAPFSDDYHSLPVVAVGPATAGDLKKMGFDIVTTPEIHTAQAVVELLESNPLPEPILFPRGKLGGETLLNFFQDHNLTVISPVVYETQVRPVEVIQNALADVGMMDVIVLGSPSAVAVCKKLFETVTPVSRVATIGPTTASACRAAGIPVWLEGSGNAEELIEALTKRYEH